MLLRNIGLILAVSALTGCTSFRNHSFIENRDTDYLYATSIPPLIIPPGLSSSTIKAHYPVSTHSYPPCVQRINLTPPELAQNSPAPHRVVGQPVVAEAEPAAKPIMAVSVPFERHHAQQQQQIAAQENTNSHYYYDSFTRSSSPCGSKAGLPLGAIIPKAPMGTRSINTAPATGNTASRASQPTASAAPASTTSPTNAIMQSLSAMWPWKNNTTANAAPAQPAAGTPAQAKTNSADNSSEQKDTKKINFYDRFTRS